MPEPLAYSRADRGDPPPNDRDSALAREPGPNEPIFARDADAGPATPRPEPTVS